MQTDECLNHPVIQGTLSAAGWFKGRDVYIGEWTDLLTRDGYTLNEPALSVMKEFGGLVLRPPFLSDAQFCTTEINFDPLLAGIGESDRAIGWEPISGCTLCAVGEVDGFFLLLMAENGRVYMDGATDLLLVGENIYEALRLLTLRERHAETVYPVQPASA